MDLNQAFKKAIEKYWDGQNFSASGKAKDGGMKYSKKYFDEFEKKSKESKDGED